MVNSKLLALMSQMLTANHENAPTNVGDENDPRTSGNGIRPVPEPFSETLNSTSTLLKGKRAGSMSPSKHDGNFNARALQELTLHMRALGGQKVNNV